MTSSPSAELGLGLEPPMTGWSLFRSSTTARLARFNTLQAVAVLPSGRAGPGAAGPSVSQCGPLQPAGKTSNCSPALSQQQQTAVGCRGWAAVQPEQRSLNAARSCAERPAKHPDPADPARPGQHADKDGLGWAAGGKGSSAPRLCAVELSEEEEEGVLRREDFVLSEGPFGQATLFWFRRVLLPSASEDRCGDAVQTAVITLALHRRVELTKKRRRKKNVSRTWRLYEKKPIRNMTTPSAEQKHRLLSRRKSIYGGHDDRLKCIMVRKLKYQRFHHVEISKRSHNKREMDWYLPKRELDPHEKFSSLHAQFPRKQWILYRVSLKERQAPMDYCERLKTGQGDNAYCKKFEHDEDCFKLHQNGDEDSDVIVSDDEVAETDNCELKKVLADVTSKVVLCENTIGAFSLMQKAEEDSKEVGFSPQQMKEGLKFWFAGGTSGYNAFLKVMNSKNLRPLVKVLNTLPTCYHRERYLKLLAFLKRCGEQVVLVGHNLVRFDAPRILQFMKNYGEPMEFCEVVHGLVDTVPHLKQGKVGKLEHLANSYLTYNKWSDCALVEGLLDHFSISREALLSSCVAMEDFMRRQVVLRNQTRLSKDLMCFTAAGISKHMIIKMAAAGVTIGELKQAMVSKGTKGIGPCLGVQINGKPRVTCNKKIVESIATFVRQVVEADGVDLSHLI
ncbi:Enolase-phosphatase E1 [Frankliniella fusca]|uniref:Enolase-phosphatase E1 n=1 Tax=Frankliniella fusca TaxID=407009 RepID=A0AAE1I318_9NEOP|nr:Enolase-phosphatase E1 [Frankliniella fusca]